MDDDKKVDKSFNKVIEEIKKAKKPSKLIDLESIWGVHAWGG